MKVLVFNGSPKREKSDTLCITKAFLKGMGENDVETINAYDVNVKYCNGCLSCMRNGGDCVIDDDMKVIIDKILSSDILIFSFPLYCYGMPAALKAIIDRTIPMSSIAMRDVNGHYEHVAQRDYTKLRSVMICGCGFPNSTHNFEGMETQFKLSFRNQPTILSVPEAPMFNAKEASLVTEPYLLLVEMAGREFVSNGNITADTMAKLSVPMIPLEVYASIVNGTAKK